MSLYIISSAQLNRVPLISVGLIAILLPVSSLAGDEMIY